MRSLFSLRTILRLSRAWKLTLTAERHSFELKRREALMRSGKAIKVIKRAAAAGSGSETHPQRRSRSPYQRQERARCGHGCHGLDTRIAPEEGRRSDSRVREPVQ